MPSSPFRLTWAAIAFALMIVLAAIALRMAVVADRSANDLRFIPPPLSDSDTYFQAGVGVIERTYPYRPYDYQPGVIYAYALIMAVVGKSIALLRLALCAIDGVAVGAVIAAGWLLTRRIWGGWLAGIFMALYPVSVYYATTILIEPFAAMLLAVWLVIALRQMEQPTRSRTILIGLLTGALFITRSNVAAVTLIYLLWGAAQRPGWRAWLTDTTIIAGMAILIISPFTAWNLYIQPEKFQLLQGDGWWQLYSANNRDGDGTGGRSAAFDAQDHPESADRDHWRNAIVRDVMIDPLRFGGLLMRKAAIFWSDAEPANNDDFYITRGISPTLQALPAVSFPYLAVFALMGLWILGFDRRDKALFFWGVIGVLFVGVLISFALSRFRYPVVILLFPLAAYGLVRIVDIVGAWRATPRPLSIQWIGRTVPLIILLIALWVFPRWALTGTPPPVPSKSTQTALPADAVPLHVTFGDEVVLEGWRYAPYTRWWPFAAQGWADVDTYPAYTVELFWSIKSETDIDYQFFISIVGDEDLRYGSLDRALGTVSYPPNPTSLWQTGQIYSEIVSFQPDAETPRERSLPVRVGVYTREGDIFTQGDITTQVPITDPANLTGVVLQTVALYEDQPSSAAVPETALHFGTPDSGQLDLVAIEMPAGDVSGVSQWAFTWQAATDISHDYNLFIHIMDSNNELASQYSNAPLPDLATSNWRPDVQITAMMDVPMPSLPGDYSVYIGLIDAQTGERLAIDAPDNRPLIGTLTVK